MELSAKGLIGKIETHAELIGAGIGVGSWGYDNLLYNISQAASGNIHMPDLSNMFRAFFEGRNRELLLTSLALYIGGEVIGMPALKKGAKGLIEGNAIQHLIYWMTHADEGCTQPGFTRPDNSRSSNASLGSRGYGGY
jgi:hypothetical protein